MFPTPKKLLSSKDIIGYTLPRLHTGKDWYVDFYVYDPTIDGLKRKKYMLNKPKSLSMLISKCFDHYFQFMLSFYIQG